MIHIRRPSVLLGKVKLRLAAIPILVAVIFVPAKAEENHARKGGASITAYASAKIHKRFEMRSDNFAETQTPIDQKIPDIGFQDCDTELRQKIEKCVLMIYEIQ